MGVCASVRKLAALVGRVPGMAVYVVCAARRRAAERYPMKLKSIG